MKSIIVLSLAAAMLPAMLPALPAIAQDHANSAPGLFAKFDQESDRKGKKRKKRKRKPAVQAAPAAPGHD